MRCAHRLFVISFLLLSLLALSAYAAPGRGLRGRGATETKQDDRSLMEMDTFAPLSCNTNANPPISSDECLANATPLSSLVNSASTSSQHVVVPCGACVLVDYTDGATVTLPGDGSLSIQGRLHFPPTASVTLNATAIFVEGLLDIPNGIDKGNMVKFSIYGHNDWYYYPHEMCSYGDTGCSRKKSVGKKPIVVAGGKFMFLRRSVGISLDHNTTAQDIYRILCAFVLLT